MQKNGNYLFGKAYWTTSVRLVERFYHLMLDLYQKIDKICVKKLKIKEYRFFVILWALFFQKPAFISSSKTTGQRLLALLTVFNILIHEVYRKLYKHFIKNFENHEIFYLLLFLGSFSSFPKNPRISQIQIHIARR